MHFALFVVPKAMGSNHAVAFMNISILFTTE